MLQATLVIGLLSRLASMPLAYWLLWCGSLGLSITLVALLRTRWGQSRPLQKCAVLSLLVHLLLAWAAMTVRFVTGDGNGGGMGPSIRVRVVDDPVDGAILADASAEALPLDIAPPLLERPPEKNETPPVEAAQAKVAEPPADSPASKPVIAESKVESPEVAGTVAATPAAIETSNLTKSAEAKPMPPEPTAKAADTQPNPKPDQIAVAKAVAADSTSATTETMLVTAKPQAAPQAATPYSLRDAPGRLGLVEQQGGSGRTESAVSTALHWMAAVQSRDGRWDADETGAGQEHMVLGQNRGGAGRGADTGISALALLAFLGAGHSHLHGDYQDTVRSGIDFLLRSQAADGSLFGDATLYAQMYCHSMATFALAEAQAMTGDRRLEPAITKAIKFSIAAQNTSTGGWRYRPGDSGDTSQLGWQMMALASARRAGIDIPTNTWSRVDRFLSTVRRGTYGGLASYRPDSPASTSMTAEALYCRLLLAEVFGSKIDDAAAEEATANLLASLPNSERVNLYYWYYATLALHHRHPQDERAAEAWNAWNDAMTTAIVSTQVTDGQNAGSWNTNTVWGGYGGRVYTTAMAAMCLEVYYRYAPPPSQREPWTATRPGSQDARE
ncbi:MAG: squalene--hopene cyclase [Planctomycetes bacterium]|nr:squalene--hopene cyclase [Planctomycetota bacterium]